jgi:HAD superfamily hydrolase (TIGR01509 family)
MKKPKAIAFDLGNVLVHIYPERFLDSLGIRERERQVRLRDPIVETVHLYERGAISTYECLEKLGEVLDYEHEKDSIRRAFASILGDPVEGMDRVVERASHHYTVALVSNTNPIHISLAEEQVRSIALFPLRFLSYELHTLKPEPEYYAKVLRGLALSPPEVVFIDDRPENVAGASEAGMTGILFADAAALVANLEALPNLKW